VRSEPPLEPRHFVYQGATVSQESSKAAIIEGYAVGNLESSAKWGNFKLT